MIDSQAVKNTCNASIESKGFCFYKCTNGIKRHLAVDILGFPFFTHCTKASVSDDQGLIEMLSQKFRPHTRPFQCQAQALFYSADAQATGRFLKRSQMGSIRCGNTDLGVN